MKDGSRSLASLFASKESASSDRMRPSRSTNMQRQVSVKGTVVDEWPMYSNRAEDYDILDQIGSGASSTVYRARFLPLDAECAVKVINIERMPPSGLDRLRNEAQLMSLSKHPNILRVRGEWMANNKLHIAARFMRSGSILDVMQYMSPDGLEETCIATILKQCLQGIHYFHQNGWMHRDIKAANLLIDDDGTVLLADFGVASAINSIRTSSQDRSNSGNARAARKSFVGTPSWMAPEVILQESYDSKADIWSFGITALELSSGHAPNSLVAPAIILQKTVADDAPTVDRTSGANKFSKTFKDIVDLCLCKDPSQRPTAEQLLAHAFFRQAKPKTYLKQALLQDLPPLESRQTRHRINTIRTIGLDGSWDFSTSPVSPEFAALSLKPPAEQSSPRKESRHRPSVSFGE